MHRTLAALAAAAAVVSSAPAFAIELNYRWKVGDVHRFTYEDDTSFEMAMGGMPGMPAGMGMPGMSAPGMSMDAGGMKARAKVVTTFSEKVLAVRPDGTADIELTVEKMQLSAGGTKTAMLSQIPPAARVVRAEVDRKGKARFYEMVTVYVQDQQMYVGVHKLSASKSGDGMTASASATANGQTVTLVAAVNPKTGTVTASASVKAAEPPPPALRKVELRQDAQEVEVLPRQLFEMMVLPDGDLPEGGRASMKTMLGEIASTVESVKPPVTRVHLEMVGNQVTVSAPAAEADQGEGEEQDMNMQAAAQGGSSKMDFDARYDFDVSAGKLLGITGKSKSDMSMGGMANVKSDSTFALKRL